MVTFAFLGNTLFLTILVSMLSTTFSHIVSNAPAEIQFRRAVLTLEGVKGDAIFAYPPPFNILAIVLLVPLKSCVSPRWFHKIHVLSVRLINLPILLVIALAERRALGDGAVRTSALPALAPAPSISKVADQGNVRVRRRLWDRWRITTHSDISTVFEVPLPDEVLGEIAADDHMTRHLIRRQFTPARPVGAPGLSTDTSALSQQQSQAPPTPGAGPAPAAPAQGPPAPAHPANPPTPGARSGSISGPAPAAPGTTPGTRSGSISGPPPPPQPGQQRLNRRDSIAPFPGLRAELHGMLSESDEMSDMAARLEGLEDGLRRVEELLGRLVGTAAGGGQSYTGDGGSYTGGGSYAGEGSYAGGGGGSYGGPGGGSYGGPGGGSFEGERTEEPAMMGARRRSLTLAELNREAEEE